MSKEEVVFLALGSNIGHKEENLQQAITEITLRAGKILSVSAFYYSEPWGFISDNTFVNNCIALSTYLSPVQLLGVLQTIESDMGRKAKSVEGVYADRIIDIDILLFGSHIVDTPTLQIPHPLMCTRDFVLIPLAEIAGEIMHPIMLKNISELTKHIER